MKSLATKEIYECCRPVVVGDSERLREAGAIAGVSLQVNSIQEVAQARSEEHTSELQSLMRISYAVFCLKKKNIPKHMLPHQYQQAHTNHLLIHHSQSLTTRTSSKP